MLVLSCNGTTELKLRLYWLQRHRDRASSEADMAEISVAILVVGGLLVADPERLQALIDRVREVLAWLAE